MKKQPHLNSRESGANLAEYSILVMLLVLVALAAIAAVGTEVSALFSNNAEQITNAQEN
jgi:Flp pilus assembly pilin Flp